MEIEFFSASAAQLSTLRCGGLLKRVFAPTSIRDLQRVFTPDNEEATVIAGDFSNTLVLSGGVDEVTVISDNLRGVTVEGDVIKAAAGEKLSHVARLARDYGLSGMEALCGIPGTVGGAARGNAGCFGSAVSDIFEGAEIFKLDTAETEYLTREEIAFNYRYSNLREGKDFITKVYFRLYPSPIVNIAAKMDEVKKQRAERQPAYPSLGSVFKNVKNESAGAFIERAGLRGYRYGGMEISERHANFIVNRGGTPEEYLYLVKLAEKKVFESFGVKLSREVKIIGERRDL